MAIIPSSKYPAQVVASDPDYPHGKAQNELVEGDGSGTPWEADLVNDVFGFQQALLADAAITPSNTPDKVGASQYLTALKTLFYLKSQVDSLFAAVSDDLDDVAASKVTGQVARFNITAATYDIGDTMALTVDQADSGYVLTGGNTVQVPARGWYLASMAMRTTLSSTSDGAVSEVRILVDGTAKLRIEGKRSSTTTSHGVPLSLAAPIWVDDPSTDFVTLYANPGVGQLSVTAAQNAIFGLTRIGAPA